ncbi:MAG: hypothetical protein FWG63_07330 [Defluviitaleaceae bacterium]|nr:hypothetical protein [Defluviitaleaceae bacterium]
MCKIKRTLTSWALPAMTFMLVFILIACSVEDNSIAHDTFTTTPIGNGNDNNTNAYGDLQESPSAITTPTDVNVNNTSVETLYPSVPSAKNVAYKRHPFATALVEYFQGGVEGSPYSAFDTWARIVDVDGDGTQGVLALRHELMEDWPILVARVFYLIDNELFYLDLENDENLPEFPQVAINQNGRLIQNVSFGRWLWSETIFGFENERLVPVMTVFSHAYEGTAEGGQTHHLYYGGWKGTLQSATIIDFEEFKKIIEMYELRNYNSPWGLADETDLILSLYYFIPV